MMSIKLVRVDERLIHGQILQAWLSHLEIQQIVLVNESVFNNPVQREFIENLSTGEKLKIAIENIETFKNKYVDGFFEENDCMVICGSLNDIKLLMDKGVSFQEINLGNIHFCESKERISDSIYLNPEEKGIIDYLKSKGAKVYIKCMPLDNQLVL
jgi:mannose/fructose/N-acetylgalactosamine-specific phosphotransferase system component IIB